MRAKMRRVFSLLAFMLLSSLPVLSKTSPAVAHPQGPSRISLPADPAIALHIGVKANWQNVLHYKLRTQTREVEAEVSSYALTETPTRDNLTDHLLTLPAPPDPKWIAFEPTTDSVRLIIDIVDTKQRLGKIVLCDLRTGQVRGSLTASDDGAAIHGEFKIPWNQPFYRVEGYDTRNSPLFRLGISHGQPDTFLHVMVVGGFIPYRPSAFSSARFIVSDPGGAVVGDPYDVRHVVICARPEDGFSLGSCALDHKNDTYQSQPLQAPNPYSGYRKKVCIEQMPGGSIGYHLNDKMDQPGYFEDFRAAVQEDNTNGVSFLSQPPYSDCTGHWHVRFVGKATAFLIVPYTVARGKGVLADLKSLLGMLAKRLPDEHIQTLAFGLEEAFQIWLHSDAGMQSGYTADMVTAMGDVKTVETKVDSQDFAVTRGLFENVTFALAPNIPPPAGGGSITIKNVGSYTPVPPPDLVGNGTLTLTFPGYTGTLKLPKGYRWEASGNLRSSYLYQPVYQPTSFQTPVTYVVRLPLVLNGLQQFTVYTVNADKPQEAISLHVQILNAVNQVVAGGDSQMQKDGKIAFSAMYLPPGIYTIKASRGSGRERWEGSVTVTLYPGRLQETTMSATLALALRHPAGK